MAIFNFKKDSKKDVLGKRLEEVPVAQIVPNPNQPRRIFDDESIAELAASISQVGLIQPLVVRKMADGYELIAGERRLRAVRSLGLVSVPCIVDGELDEDDSALMAIIENLQRENLHYFEEAECYSALLSKLNVTQEELATRLGKSQSFIANKLRMLKFSPEIRESITASALSERHARALLRLSDDSDRIEAISRITKEGLSVKESERLVDNILNNAFDSKKAGAKPRPKIVRIFKDYRLFMNSVNAACNQLRDSGMIVEVEQSDRVDGVDIVIRITQND